MNSNDPAVRQFVEGRAEGPLTVESESARRGSHLGGAMSTRGEGRSVLPGRPRRSPGLLIWKIEDSEARARGAAKTISVQFDDVAGLKEKADVRIAGVLVGKVAQIRLVGGKALVDIELDQGRRAARGRLGLDPEPGHARRQVRRADPGPVGAAALPEGTTLQGDAPVSFDQITKLARDIEVDIRDITSNLKESLGGALGEERLTGIVDNVLVLSQELRKILRVQPREHRRDDRQLPRVLDADDPARRPHRQARRVQLGQRDRQRRQREGAHDEAPDDGRQHERDHGQDRRGPGHGRRSSSTSDETSKNLNEALVAVKEGVDSLTGAHEDGQEAQLRSRPARGVPDRPEQGEGRTSPWICQRVGTPALLPPRALEPAVRRPARHDDDHDDDVPGRPHRGRPRRTRPSSRTPSRSPRRSATGSGTGSAGPALIENSGGAGIDYLTLKDRLRFSAEVWDFGGEDNLNAHAKLSGRYYFSPVGLRDRRLGRLPEHEGESGFVLRRRRACAGATTT